MTQDEILNEIRLERWSQDVKFGLDRKRGWHGEGTDAQFMIDTWFNGLYEMTPAMAQSIVKELSQVKGALAWADILMEEVVEALAESDTERVVQELIQVAAVAVATIESITQANEGTE